MTLPRSLAAALAAAMLLAACADDVPDPADTAAEQPAEDPTEEPADIGDEPAEDEPAHDAGDAAGEADDEAAAGGTQPTTVALTFDGQSVPIVEACRGVDGAVLARTEGEVTITLVQEEGTALRYQAEGMTAETDEVEVEEVGASTVYRATLESEQVPAVDVELELADASALEDC